VCDHLLFSVHTDERIAGKSVIFHPYGQKTVYLGAIFCPQNLVHGITGRVDNMCYLHLCIFTSYVLVMYFAQTHSIVYFYCGWC